MLRSILIYLKEFKKYIYKTQAQKDDSFSVTIKLTGTVGKLMAHCADCNESGKMSLESYQHLNLIS